MPVSRRKSPSGREGSALAEPVISRETMLAGLHEIRPPASDFIDLFAGMAGALGLGLLLAILLSLLLKKFISGQQFAPESSENILAGNQDRAVTLLHLIRERNPGALPADTRALYAPGGMPEIAELEAMLAAREARDA